MGSEALAKCYNVHNGLLRRLWRVAVVVNYNSTTVLRQKPWQVSTFGEGIDYRTAFAFAHPHTRIAMGRPYGLPTFLREGAIRAYHVPPG
jgi:hypothetical protein